jgi:peptidoglycan/xylan/chitin deacetylase (PgdA/CDA1 family)
MRGDYTRFTYAFIATLIAGLAFIVCTNVLVDPLGFYRLMDRSGFNEIKPAIYTRVRAFKAFEVRRIRPRTIILGSSRTHVGFRCSHPALVKLEGPCYNLAFDGATTKEMYFYLVHAQTIRPLKHVILGLDGYHPSLAAAFTRPGFDPLLLNSPDVANWMIYLTADLRLLISADLFELSVNTVFDQRSAAHNWFAADGQRIGEVFFREVDPAFRVAGPRAYFDAVDRSEVKNQLPVVESHESPRKGHEEEASSLSYIARIIAFCRRHQIDLRVFLTPAHVHQLEITAAISGDESIETAKIALVKLLAEDAAQHPGERAVPLFDFSGYSSITTEALPPLGSRREMQAYWDSSHFKSSVGDLVLDVLFHHEDPAHPIPPDFDKLLTADTLHHSQEIASLRSLIPGLPILVYHRILEGDIGNEDPSTAISRFDFDQQMKYLHDEGYVSLNMEEVVQFLQGKPFPRKVVAIHFDDGWKSAKAALPILSQYGLKASFWIIAGAGHDMGSPHMDWSEIGELAKLANIDIYSHTMTHPCKVGETLRDWLTGSVPNKGLEQAKWELIESRLELEDHLVRGVPYLAWPCGIYSDRLIKLAQDLGYHALLTIDDGVNRPGGDIFRIHRTMINGACRLSDFKDILSDGAYRRCGVPEGRTVVGSASANP